MVSRDHPLRTSIILTLVLWVGRHRISMVTSGLTLRRSTVICWLARIAYVWPGPGSSAATPLLAAWASVKIVTLSSALARSAHPTSYASWL